MGSNVKELSGMFMSAERWQAVLQEFCLPTCSATHIRLFHNTPQQVEQMLAALSSNSNSSVTRLFIGELEPQGAKALATFLSMPTCTVQHLEVQQLTDPAATAQALLPGLHAASSLTTLQLQRCEDDAALAAIAAALIERTANSNSMADPLTLSLQRCRVGAASGAALGALVACGGTAGLIMNTCKLNDTSLQPLLSALSQPAAFGQVSLRHLGLSDNQLDLAAAHSLAAALPGLLGLDTLVLSDNPKLQDQGVAGLARGIALCPSLTQLDLAGCGFGTNGVLQLAQALYGPTEKGNHTDGAAGDSSQAVDMATSTPGTPALKQVVLDRNNLGAAGFAGLVSAIRGSCAAPTLEQLSVQSCQIDGTAISAVSAAQPAVSPEATPDLALRVLRLGDNPLGDQGMAWVASTLLGAGTDLQELDAPSAGFGDAGADTIVTLMGKQGSLHTLRVNGNSFRERGATRLCSGVAQHPGLRCFRAEGCRLIEGPARARLAEASRLIAARSEVDPAATSSATRVAKSALSAPQISKLMPQAAAAVAKADIIMEDAHEECAAAGVATPAAHSGRRGISSCSPTPVNMDVDSVGTCRVAPATPTKVRTSGQPMRASPRQAGSASGGLLATNGGGVTKHRLEPSSSAHTHAAKHHHADCSGTVEQHGKGSGDVGDSQQYKFQPFSSMAAQLGSMTDLQHHSFSSAAAAVNAAHLDALRHSSDGKLVAAASCDMEGQPLAWQIGASSAARVAAQQLQQGKTFSGCSATSIDVCGAPSSPSAIAYVQASEPSDKAIAQKPNTVPAKQKCARVTELSSSKSLDLSGVSKCGTDDGGSGGGGGSALAGANSWTSASTQHQAFQDAPERHSGGSCCSASFKYSRRFRPLTGEQQAMFVDF